MKAKRISRGLGVILGLAFIMGMVFYPGSSFSADKVLKIGAIFPLSGKAATWGLAAQKAITLKQKEVNGRGGLNVGGEKYKIEIIWEDDKYNAATAGWPSKS